MGDDAEYRLRLTLVKDTDAAAETKEAIDGIAQSAEGLGEKAGEGEKGLKRMIQEAGTIREAQRISQGFFDIFLGGGRTIQGTAEIMRFFIATAADINPIFASLAVVGASIAVIAGRQAEHNKTMEEGKDAAFDFATAIETAGKRIERVQAAELEDRRMIDASYEEAATSAERQATALEKQLKNIEAIREAELKLAEQRALIDNKGGAEGALAIQQRFAGIKAGLQEGVQLEVIDAQSAAKTGEQAQTRNQLQDKFGELRDKQTQLNDATAARDAAVAKAGRYGILPDEKGSYETARKDAEEAERKASEKYSARALEVANYKANSVDPNNDFIKSMEAEAEKAREALSLAGARARAAADAERAQTNFDDSNHGSAALQKEVDDTKIAITKLRDTIDQQADALTDLALQRKKVVEDAAGTDLARQTQDAKDKQALADRNFAASNKAAIDKAQADSVNEDLTPTDRSNALRRVTKLKNDALQRQLDEAEGIHGFVRPEKEVTQEEKSGITAQITLNLQELTKALQALTDKSYGVGAEQKPKYDEATKALQGLVEKGADFLGHGNNTEAKNALAETPDMEGKARFLGDYYKGASNEDESRLAQQIADALAQRQANSPAPMSAAGQESAGTLARDQLSQKLNEAVGAAHDAGMGNLEDAVNHSVTLHEKSVEVAQRLEATVSPRLIELGRQIAALDAAVETLKGRTQNGNTH